MGFVDLLPFSSFDSQYAIIAQAVTWFTGQAVEEEMVAAMGEVLFPEGEEDNGPDISSPHPAPTPGQENPECKQS